LFDALPKVFKIMTAQIGSKSLGFKRFNIFFAVSLYQTPIVIHLNYNGNTVDVFESYLNQISKMAMHLNCI